MTRFLQMTVLHKYSYVTPKQVAQKVRSMHQTCEQRPFLDCCLEYAEVRHLCEQFASMTGNTELSDPHQFIQAVEASAEEEVIAAIEEAQKNIHSK